MIVLAQAADPQQVRETVEEVLSRPAYTESGTGDSLLSLAIDALLEAIGRTLLQLDFGGPGGSVWGAVGLLALVVGLIVLIVALLRRFRRGGELEQVVEGPVGRSPRDWAAEADDHEAAGAYREALRCRYRETLAVLAAEDLVTEIPGRTTGEYRAAVGAAVPDARTAFGALTATFEAAWYGGRTVDAAQLAEAKDQQRTTLAAAGIRRRARVGA